MKMYSILAISLIAFLLLPGLSYAWWNAGSYPYRSPIINNQTTEYPISVNDTSGINDHVIWSVIGNSSYVYSTASGPTGTIAIANDSVQKYWENETDRTGNSPASVWDSDYEGVWHMVEESGTTYDSTSKHNGSVTGATGTASGRFGSAIDCDGTDDYVDIGTWNATSQFTIELWVNYDAVDSASGGLVYKENHIQADISTVGKVRLYIAGISSGWIESDPIPTGQWFYIVYQNNGSYSNIFINGKLNVSASESGTITDSGWGWRICARAGGSDTDLDGIIDEVRVSNLARSHDYILQQYYNGINNLTRLGAEESGDAAPAVTIAAPSNATLVARNTTLNFTVTDDIATELPCWKEFDSNGTITSLGNVTASTYYNETLTALEIGSHTINITCQDISPQNTSTTRTFSIIHWNITSQNAINEGYETNSSIFNSTVEGATDWVTDINATLNWGSLAYISNESGTGNWTFEQNLTIPIIPTNNTNYTYYFNYNITFSNGTTVQENSTLANQTIYFSYWINGTEKNTAIFLEGETLRFNVSVYKVLDNAEFNATMFFNITNETTLFETLNASTHSKYGYNTFVLPNISSYNETAVELWGNVTITLGSDSRTIGSTPETLAIYRLTVTNCSFLTNTTMLQFFLQNETDRANITGDLRMTINIWKDTLNRTYSFDETNASSFRFCIYPVWETYNTDAELEFENSDTNLRTYYLTNATITNTTSNIDLYLLSQTLADMVTLKVEAGGVGVEDVYVKIQKYFLGANAYVTVAIVKTDYSGQGITYLQLYDIYYKFIIEYNNNVTNEISPLKLLSDTITLPYMDVSYGGEWTYYDKIAWSCDYNNVTWVFRCTVTDTSGHMQTARLIVDKKEVLGFTRICDNSTTTSGASLICGLGNTTGKMYHYDLSASFNPTYSLETGFLDYTGVFSFGLIGIFLTLLLVLTLASIGWWSPPIAIGGAITGLIAGRAMGLIAIEWGFILSIALVGAIIIYKLRS